MGWSGPMTHRQYIGWLAWLELQWETPSRSDWYQMQTTSAVYNVLGARTEPKEFKLKFSNDTPSVEMTPQEYAEMSKSVWLGAFGIQGQ